MEMQDVMKRKLCCCTPQLYEIEFLFVYMYFVYFFLFSTTVDLQLSSVKILCLYVFIQTHAEFHHTFTR